MKVLPFTTESCQNSSYLIRTFCLVTELRRGSELTFHHVDVGVEKLFEYAMTCVIVHCFVNLF